jgi:hypothetical protein
MRPCVCDLDPFVAALIGRSGGRVQVQAKGGLAKSSGHGGGNAQ